MSLLNELKRRNVFKVASVYLITSWLIIQVISVVSPYLKLPDTIGTITIVILFIGFPLACIFAWAFELTPDGLKRTDEVPIDSSATKLTGQKINFSIIALLSVALVFLLVDKFVLQTPVEPTDIEQAKNTSNEQIQYQSIAVLPFQNMSSDPNQEYFSDGISEELLNSLAKLRELKVAARTSSFSFKGTAIDIKAIGEQLAVDTVLEGSVRKFNDRIRVTAQLIDARNGFHLWSETYDRELEDIFAIQDDITSNIMNALSAFLEFEAPSNLNARKVNIEAYDYYLQGRQAMRRYSIENVAEGLELFQKATSIDPSLAEAWAGQAMAVVQLRETAFWGDIPRDEANARATEYIEKALSIDASLSEAYIAKAGLYMDNYEFEEALANANLAVQYSPNSSIALGRQGLLQGRIGKLKSAKQSVIKAVELDPLDERLIFYAVGLALESSDESFFEWVKSKVSVLPNSSQLKFRLDFHYKYNINRTDGTVLKELLDEKDNLHPRLYSPILFYALKQLDLSDLENATRFPHEEAMRYLASANMETEAMTLYNKLSAERQNADINLEELSVMQASLGDCNGAIESLKRAHGGESRVYGVIGPNASRSNSNLALNKVFCLQQLNQPERIGDLLERVRYYSNTILSDSENGSYMLRSKIHVLDGKPDEAIKVLQEALEQRSLNWTVRYDPILQTLSDKPEFIALFQEIDNKIAQTRESLGLPELSGRLELIE